MSLEKETGIRIGTLPKGKRNLITDVPGVKVGHVTLNEGKMRTGVTAILPHDGNLFKEKVMAGCCIINGFGKSTGLIQIEEMGTLETPIVMTNTLSVGTAYNALVQRALEENLDIGRKTGTVNCVVTECNDGALNDIRGLHVKETHVHHAIDNADVHFEQGAVGAGTGMTCMGVKGGIGSSSRVISLDGKNYTVGAIVLSNFGAPGDLRIGEDWIGRRIQKVFQRDKVRHMEEKNSMEGMDETGDQGSIIIVLATDIPLSERQLKRIAKRSVVSLGRVGSYLGNGSGDISIAFTTAARYPHYSDNAVMEYRMLHDEKLDSVFRGVAESVEESIISSLYFAEPASGYNGRSYHGLKEFLQY